MNNEQIIDYAIKDEEDAYALYKSTARRVNNDVSQILMKLANMEKGHAAKLRSFKSGKLDSIGKTDVEDLNISEFLQQPELNANSSVRDVLIYAIKSEEAAAQLYLELSRRFYDIDKDHIFELLAKEELKHKHDLEKIFSEGKFEDIK